MEQFMERLVRSRSHFEEFARKQASMGVDIYTPPINDAPTHAARWAHRDSKDGVLIMAVEHKRRGISFTDRASFPYDTVIVDEVYKVDDKPHPCLIYICENAAGTHAAVVYGWTRCNWLKETDLTPYKIGTATSTPVQKTWCVSARARRFLYASRREMENDSNSHRL